VRPLFLEGERGISSVPSIFWETGHVGLANTSPPVRHPEKVWVCKKWRNFL
jgi:hypothetical protein